MKFKLGSKLRDKVTGFEGIATAHVTYLNGCEQYCVKPPIGTDGKMTEGEYIDVQELEKVNDGIHLKPKRTGGPQRDCPKPN